MAKEGEGKHSSVLDQFPKHAEKIALIIANWTAIESVLVQWMAYLLKTDHERSLVLWNELSSIAPKIKFIKRLARRYLKDCDEKNALLDLLGKIQNDSKLRHRYAHAIYSCNSDATVISISPGTAPDSDKEWLLPTEALTVDDLNIHLGQLVERADKAHLTKIEKIPLTD